MPISYEARCTRCGDHFCPLDEDDLEHVERVNGEPCGGEGILLGTWG